MLALTRRAILHAGRPAVWRRHARLVPSPCDSPLPVCVSLRWFDVSGAHPPVTTAPRRHPSLSHRWSLLPLPRWPGRMDALWTAIQDAVAQRATSLRMLFREQSIPNDLQERRQSVQSIGKETAGISTSDRVCGGADDRQSRRGGKWFDSVPT